MIVVAGEAVIDLVPAGEQLVARPGGSPFNVAIGLGRLGRATSYLGVLSRDAFGQRLAACLDEDDVATSSVVRTDAPTTLAVVHLDEQGRASYAFYVEGTSAARLGDGPVPSLPAGAALHVSLGAVTATMRPAGAALTGLLASAGGDRLKSLDPNVRSSMVGDLAAYRPAIGSMVAEVDVCKVSHEDLAALEPGAQPLSVARRWAGSGPALVVVTLGDDGAVALRPDGTQLSVPGEPVPVVDTVGAGDAFTAGLLAGLDRRGTLSRAALLAMDDADMIDVVHDAVHVAALTCARTGADPPYLAQV